MQRYKNKIGSYQYLKNGKPYQNSSITTTPDADEYYTQRPLQKVTYNSFKAPIEIVEDGIDKISFGYNVMQQRSVMYYGSTNADKLTRPFRKYYSADGSMEVKVVFASNNTVTPVEVELLTYIGGDAYTAPMVIKSNGTTQNYFYLHRDYQSSILAITNEAGKIVEKRQFDPWGGISKIQDGAGNNLTKLTFFDRGYTGHEHLQSVGLINMNARLYDPMLHRFLQPDNVVQDIYNTQAFNRYGYCWNNPLKFTDPSGNELLVSAILIGAAIGLASYFTMNLISGNEITLKGALMATFMGAVSGAVTFGIGWALDSVGAFALKATYGALAHGTFQGLVSGIQGGGFWAGFAAGSIASLASSIWQGNLKTENGFFKENNWAYGAKVTGQAGIGVGGKAGMIAFGTIMGGAGAALTGGNFWQGAVTGLVVSGLNHAMHLKALDDYEEGLKEYYGIVAGESTDNQSEAQGIGEVILRRLELKGKNISKGFVKHIGGEGQFDAIGGKAYNYVMKLSLDEIRTIVSNRSGDYHLRLAGAVCALVHPQSNVSNGAYFWNATAQKNWKNIGFNWRSNNNGTFQIAAEIGKTTFFKYTNTNKHWP